MAGIHTSSECKTRTVCARACVCMCACARLKFVTLNLNWAEDGENDKRLRFGLWHLFL